MIRKRLVLCLIVISVFFCGCQPTPEDEIVVNKNDGKLEKLIMDEPIQQEATNSEEKAQSIELLEENSHDGIGESAVYTEKWIENYTLSGLECVIDADIILHETVNHPVYKAQQINFDMVTVRSVVDYFTVGATGVRDSSLTKEDIELMLIQARRGQYTWDDNGGRWESYEGQAEEIAELEKLLNQAEEESFEEIVTDDFVLPMKSTFAFADGSKIHVKAKEKSIRVFDDNLAGVQLESWIIIGDAYPGEPKGTTLDNIQISEEEASNVVTNMLEDLGIHYLGIARTEKARLLKDISFEVLSEGWQITLSRNDGSYIPIHINPEEVYGTLFFEPETYAQRWPSEIMTVYVDETGIRELSWEYPIEAIGILNSNVQIMSVEDTKNDIKKYIKLAFSKVQELSNINTTRQIKVTSVVLTSQLIPMKDELEYFMIVPAWVVFYEEEDPQGVYTSAIAINAIDGSSINLLV